MKRRFAFLKISLTAGFFSLLLPCLAAAGTWEEMGEGSATPPGIVRIGNFRPDLEPSAYRQEYPLALAAPAGQPMILFQGIPVGATIPPNRTFGILYSGGGWGLIGEGTASQAFGSVSALPNTRVRAMRSGSGFIASIVGRTGQSVVGDAFATFLSGDLAWGGRGGSLDAGGLSQTSEFSRQVWASAPAMDLFGTSYIAWNFGTASRREITVRRFFGGEWTSLDPAPGQPTVPSPNSSVSIEHPALGFSGASPVLAWTERMNNAETLKLMRYSLTNQTWEGLADSMTNGLGGGRHAQIANVEGRNTFIVAFENRINGELTLLLWNGSEFQDIGNPLTPWGLERVAVFDDLQSGGGPSIPAFSLALDTQGRPVVAFRAESPAGSGQYHIFVSYRDATNQWIALGDAESATGVSGIGYTVSGTPPPRGHYAPSIHMGVDNRPVVAWMFDDETLNPHVILVRRYSETINPGATLNPETAINQIVARLLGVIDGNDVLDTALDDNEDGLLDSADLERWTSRL